MLAGNGQAKAVAKPLASEIKVDATQKLTPWENTMVGISAGIIEVTVLQPMLYCKNATQQGLPFTKDPRVLYRGLAMSVTNMAILTGLQFPLVGAVTKVITQGETRRLTDFEQIASGFTGGVISGVACAPMELIMIQQQRIGGSIVATPARILSQFGGQTFFRGLVTSCGREGLFTAGYLGIAPVIQRTLTEQYSFSEGLAKPCAAIGAGVIAATGSHPMDTIKTCMQGDVTRENYGTLTQTASVLYKEQGIGRFFNGWAWRTSRMICAVFIMNECKLRVSPILFPDKFA